MRNCIPSWASAPVSLCVTMPSVARLRCSGGGHRWYLMACWGGGEVLPKLVIARQPVARRTNEIFYMGWTALCWGTKGMSKSPSPNLRLVDRLERRLLIGRSEARTDVAKPGAESGQAGDDINRQIPFSWSNSDGVWLRSFPPWFQCWRMARPASSPPALPRLRRVGWADGWTLN